MPVQAYFASSVHTHAWPYLLLQDAVPLLHDGQLAPALGAGQIAAVLPGPHASQHRLKTYDKATIMGGISSRSCT